MEVDQGDMGSNPSLTVEIWGTSKYYTEHLSDTENASFQLNFMASSPL